MTTLRLEDVHALKWAGAKLLAAAVGLRSLEVLFATRPLLAVVMGALWLDWWAQRLKARWSDSEGRLSAIRPALRALAAIAFGVALGWVMIGAAAVTHTARVRWGHWHAIGFSLGAFRTAAYAFRDELLLRGIPLALTRGRIPPRWSIGFSTVLAVAPWTTEPGVRIESLLLVASMGLFLALVWQDGPGGLVAWGVHAGWLLVVQIVAQGALLDIEWSRRSPSAGAPAYFGACLFLLSSITLYRWKRTAPP
ncbi:MAG TPA: hypothetical protein VF881_17650 [Polyangiaceae bacterium]